MKPIKFLSARKWTTIFSIVFITISIFSLMSKGLNLGIDFTGGIQIEISYESGPKIEDVRQNLAIGGYEDAIVQNSGSSTDLMIRIPPRNSVNNKKVGEDVIKMLQSPENPVTLMSSEYISAQVGEELTEQGGLAMMRHFQVTR